MYFFKAQKLWVLVKFVEFLDKLHSPEVLNADCRKFYFYIFFKIL